jgi:hypothetical protein
MKICVVEPKLFHADGRTDRQADIRKLIVAVCDFVSASENSKKESSVLSNCRYVRLSTK